MYSTVSHGTDYTFTCVQRLETVATRISSTQLDGNFDPSIETRAGVLCTVTSASKASHTLSRYGDRLLIDLTLGITRDSLHAAGRASPI